jgi:hypothetical protein
MGSCCVVQAGLKLLYDVVHIRLKISRPAFQVTVLLARGLSSLAHHHLAFYRPSQSWGRWAGASSFILWLPAFRCTHCLPCCHLLLIQASPPSCCLVVLVVFPVPVA